MAKIIKPEDYAHLARNERKHNTVIVHSPVNLETQYPDMSTYGEKQAKITTLLKDRTIWHTDNKYERPTLPNDKMYLQYELLLKRCTYHTAIRGRNAMSRSARLIDTTFKSSAKYPNVVFTTTLHAREDTTNDIPDAFCAVTINDKSVEYNIGNERKTDMLGNITLFRFDSHGNNHKNYPENDLQNKYFGEDVSGPHFHFYNRTQVKKHLDKKAECDAISLNNLLCYLEDLNKAQLSDEICQDDLGMPFLQIKKRPTLYFTDLTILGKYRHATQDLMQGKVKTMQNFVAQMYVAERLYNGNSIIEYGLDAVITDLKIMQMALNGSICDMQDDELSAKIDKYRHSAITMASRQGYGESKGMLHNMIDIGYYISNQHQTIANILAEKIAMLDIEGLHSQITHNELVELLIKKHIISEDDDFML